MVQDMELYERKENCTNRLVLAETTEHKKGGLVAVIRFCQISNDYCYAYVAITLRLGIISLEIFFF